MTWSSSGEEEGERGRTLLGPVQRLDHLDGEVDLHALVGLDAVDVPARYPTGSTSASLGRARADEPRGRATHMAFCGSVQSTSCAPICSGVTMLDLSLVSSYTLRSTSRHLIMTCSSGREASQYALARDEEREERRERGTHVGDAPLVGRVRVAVDGEEVRQALPQLGVVGRLAGEVQEHEARQDLQGTERQRLHRGRRG